jgi:glutathione S-transferase
MYHSIMSIHHIPVPILKREHYETTLRPLQNSLLDSLIFLESLLASRNSSSASPLSLCGGSHPSIADLSTSCELLQISSVGYSFFPRFPLITRWLGSLSSLSSFQEVSKSLGILGKEANSSSAKYLNLEVFSSPS